MFRRPELRVFDLSWCREIVYIIPKVAGVDDLDKQRPLKLQEALKKLALGIRKDRMSALSVCSDDQCAFLRGLRMLFMIG